MSANVNASSGSSTVDQIGVSYSRVAYPASGAVWPR